MIYDNEKCFRFFPFMLSIVLLIFQRMRKPIFKSSIRALMWWGLKIAHPQVAKRRYFFL